MTLPRHQYRDPLDVLLRAEEESCKGCTFRTIDSNSTKARCKNPASGTLLAEKRCDDYEERE